MNERQMQFRVGVVMFATMTIGALLATLNGPVPTDWLPWGRTTYAIAIELPEAPGVGQNTPVRKNGLLIGRVAAVDDRDHGVTLRVNVDGDRRLLSNHVPHVRTSVLGDATIDFMTTATDVPPQPLQDGAAIPGVVDPNPFDAISKLGDLQDDIQETMHALTRAGNEVADLAHRVDDAFGTETEEGRVKRLLDTTETAMAQFAQTMSSINEVLGDAPLAGPMPGDQPNAPGAQPFPNGVPPAGTQPPIDGRQLRQRIRQGLYELPEVIGEARVAMQKFDSVLQSADNNLKNLEGFTEPLGQSGVSITQSILDALEGVNRLVKEFTVLSQSLNRRDGTLGQLIHNPQLYENVNRLVYNANLVVCRVNELTTRLQVVAEDARVFMDKVAREPGRVVTGGIKPSVIK